MTARAPTERTPRAAPAPSGGPTNGSADEGGRARALRQWRPRAGGRRDGAGGAAGLSAGKAALRRPASSPPPAPCRCGKAARGYRRRPRPSPVGTEPSSVVAPPGCEKRRLTASGGTRPVSGSGSWLSRAAPKERQRSHGSRRLAARHGVRRALRFSSAPISSAALSCCPAAAVPTCRFPSVCRSPCGAPGAA